MTKGQGPSISVIIPTCGRPELLLECVTSLIKNDFKNFEILIINQNSDVMLQAYLHQKFPEDSRLRYFYLHQAGASRARNFGVQEAQGKIVAFIDDDAIADTGWLRAIEEAFATLDPKPALIGGRIEPIWHKKKPCWYPPERIFLLGLYNIGDKLRPMPEFDQPIGANMAGLREIVIALGGFDENLGPNYFRKNSMITGEEAILGQRARKAGYELYYQPKALVHHQISKNKLSRSYFLRRNFWEGVTIINEIYLLGEIKSGKAYYIYDHASRVLKSAGLFLCPSFQHKHNPPFAAVRMLALSRVAYSLGVLYGLFNMQPSARARGKKCGSE